MNNKLHWGHGIFAFYSLFVAVVIFALIASRSVDRSLVLDDYYSLDLAYQDRMNEIESAKYSQSLKITEVDKSKLIFDFTSPLEIEGEIHFYRSSDSKLDRIYSIDNHRMEFDKSKFKAGVWKIKVDWKEGDNKFYKVEDFYF